MSRARNNIARLPQNIRYQIARMLADGATYDEVRAEIPTKEVLHNTTFGAYLKSEEYATYKSAFLSYDRDIQNRKMAAELVEQENGVDTYSKIAEFELTKQILDQLQNGDLSTKELSSLRNALNGNYKKIIAEKDAEIEKLKQIISSLQEALSKLSGTVSSQDVLDVLDANVGL